MQKNTFTVTEAVQKLEYYCSYQERCHQEVEEKLKALKMTAQETDEIIVHLINQNSTIIPQPQSNLVPFWRQICWGAQAYPNLRIKTHLIDIACRLGQAA